MVREDLPAGLRAAQAVHAAVEHALAWPSATRASPTVAVLGARDELRLAAVLDDLERDGHDVVAFHEPDLAGELTALATTARRQQPALRRLPPPLPSRGGDNMTMMTLTPEQELRELRAEVDVLRAQLEGDLPRATAWLQWKVWRQRAELDRLCRRVTAQRFTLRTLDGLGRSLSREEYLEARAAAPEALQERLDD